MFDDLWLAVFLEVWYLSGFHRDYSRSEFLELATSKALKLFAEVRGITAHNHR